jgi:hypothetical protein
MVPKTLAYTDLGLVTRIDPHDDNIGTLHRAPRGHSHTEPSHCLDCDLECNPITIANTWTPKDGGDTWADLQVSGEAIV